MTTTHEVGDLLVWYIPQVPGEAYEVSVPSRDLAEASRIQEAILGLSIFEFENNVKPDYSDATGIVRWEPDEDGDFGWFEVDEGEILDAAAEASDMLPPSFIQDILIETVLAGGDADEAERRIVAEKVTRGVETS